MTRWALALALALALLVSAVRGAELANVTGRVQLRTPPPTTVLLNGGQYSTVVRRDGTFVVADVPPGVYTLELFATEVVFPFYRLSVEEDGKVRALEFRFPGAPKQPARYPLEVRRLSQPSYFEPRRQSSVWGFLSQPMVIMAVVMIGLVVVMPMMMGSMDEEQMKQMQQQTKGLNPNGNPAEALLGMFGVQMPKPADEDADEDDKKEAKEAKKVKNVADSFPRARRKAERDRLVNESRRASGRGRRVADDDEGEEDDGGDE